MPIYKNVANQKFFIYAHNVVEDEPKTGDSANITTYLFGDGGAGASLGSPTELDATNGKGIYYYSPSQANTNYDVIVLSPVSTTANIVLDPVTIITDVPSGLRKGVALSKFKFYMASTADPKLPATGKTITVERALDDAAFAACTNSPATELSNGWYKIDLSTSDMDGDNIALKMTGTGAIQNSIAIQTTS